jgi:hypothetical protein
MPTVPMSALWQTIWDRNAYRVRKGMVPMFRIHPQITSSALSSGEPGPAIWRIQALPTR